MTSAARVQMVLAAKRALDDAARVAQAQAELYLATSEDEREVLMAHFAEQNRPEAIRARALRLARATRRRQAAERPFADMGAFEAQFSGAS